MIVFYLKKLNNSLQLIIYSLNFFTEDKTKTIDSVLVSQISVSPNRKLIKHFIFSKIIT